jgi:hypothetical protein
VPCLHSLVMPPLPIAALDEPIRAASMPRPLNASVDSGPTKLGQRTHPCLARSVMQGRDPGSRF